MIKYFSDIYNSTTAILSGMYLTINHLFRAKKGIATLQYPEERWPRPERTIGFDHGSYNVIRSRLHVDIDDCIEQAMIMIDQIKEGGHDYPVPMEIWR